jgi:2-iminobutanoate/2-iminopropanoate deaminase
MPTAATRAFSPGLKLGDTIYLSGHLGIDASVGKPPADISQEARDVMKSVETTLEEGGLTMDDLVYVEVYCTDLSLYGAFNKEYVAFFHKPYPARDFIGVKDLLFGAHFEVMGIARKHASRSKKELRVTR